MANKNADKRSVTTDALDTLGTIITPNEKRDAIHLAVENVVAAEILAPNDDVGFLPDGRVGKNAAVKLGKVDPFLTNYVMEGVNFWLVVYPRQITSLRHVWEHPSFPASELSPSTPSAPKKVRRKAAAPKAMASPETPLPAPVLDPDVEESERWLEDYAAQIDITYKELIRAADDFVSHGEYLIDGGKFEGESLPNGFWDHYERVTGNIVPENERWSFFSCSC